MMKHDVDLYQGKVVMHTSGRANYSQAGNDWIEQLSSRLLQGEPWALARLISMLENDPSVMAGILPVIQPYLGRAFCVGLTGPPGAGKSSLINQMVKLLRQDGDKVGIIAVDPTSPFSGGALLGDRIRLQDHCLDPGVFIRSMATRGNLGGLARATKDTIKLMDAAGMDYVLVETVGVGQTELDIAQTTDITVVVLVPESGDSIQVMKAGLMEIADIFVVNKSDRPGADLLEAQLQAFMQINPDSEISASPIFQTQGLKGIGIEDLLTTVRFQRSRPQEKKLELRRQERSAKDFEDILKYTVIQEWRCLMERDPDIAERYKEIVVGAKDPYTALKELFPDGVVKH